MKSDSPTAKLIAMSLIWLPQVDGSAHNDDPRNGQVA